MDPQQNNTNVGMGETKSSSAGPIIGVAVIVAIILLGCLYFWSQRADNEAMMTDQSVESINQQGSSDEAAAIEADLNATDVDNLDAELNAS